jgi:hypothetical protein
VVSLDWEIGLDGKDIPTISSYGLVEENMMIYPVDPTVKHASDLYYRYSFGRCKVKLEV